ncbi:MAG: helix-turn-helix domain-containing protein [Vallitalea sp.]|jgi:transcriptional regulator with XRE-family HTH domain|nr:helix-turn-helix domain-containing protein [Vallitalea sp.]
MDNNFVGKRIKLARQQYSVLHNEKVTQQILANKLNISRTYLADIESGRTNANSTILNKICKALNQPITFFIESKYRKEKIADELINYLIELDVIKSDEELTEDKLEWVMELLGKAIDMSRIKEKQ